MHCQAEAEEARQKNLKSIEKTLKKSSEKARERYIKSYGLGNLFDADGSLKSTSGSTADALDKRYYSVTARGKEETILEDLRLMSEENDEEIKPFTGELTEKESTNFTKMKKALTALNKRRGSDVSFVLVEENNSFNGATRRANTIYISKDTLGKDAAMARLDEAAKSGNYAGTLFHEYGHTLNEKGQEKLISFLEEDEELAQAARERILTDYGFTKEEIEELKNKAPEEMTAEERDLMHAFEREYSSTLEEYYLGDEWAVNKLVSEDAPLAEKIIGKLGGMLKNLSGKTDAGSREDRKRLKKALRLYEKAVSKSDKLDNKEIKKLFADLRDDEEEEIRIKDGSYDAENNENEPLTNITGQNVKVREGGFEYSVKDYPIDSNIEKTVNKAYSEKSSSMYTLCEITSEQNKAINGLVNRTNNDSYRGKYTGGKHLISSNAIKHIISEHGDFLREGLRAQLPMTPEDISRHLSAVKDNKRPSSITASKTGRGTPSILTSYEVNGYTLFAEEITKSLGKNSPSDLIGHTMYKAPTLATGHFNTTSVQTQPKRQSTVLCYYYTTNNKDLSSGNFIQNSNNEPAILNYLTVNGVAKQDPRSGGLIPLSSSSLNFTDKKGNVEQGYVRCNKMFYITSDNRVFSNSETDVSAKIEELKKQGYDCFVFDKKTGDNYLVAVVNKAQIIKNKPTKYSRKASSDTVTMSKGELQKRRANYDNEKVYGKNEIVKALGEVELFKSLPKAVRDSYIEDMWQKFNLFKDPQRLGWAIDFTADKLFNDILKNADVAERAAAKRINALKKEADQKHRQNSRYRSYPC